MKVYRGEVRLIATAYIKAETDEAAMQLLLDHFGAFEGFELAEGGMVSDLKYNDPDLPEVSISPAVTCSGPADPDEPMEVAWDSEDD